MKGKKKLVLIGPFPPPYGGVGVHIQRLEYWLHKDFEISIIDESRLKKKGIFNLRTLNVIRYLSIIFRGNIIHLHSGSTLLRLTHFTIAKLLMKNIVITIHSYKTANKNRLMKWIDKKLLQYSRKTIFVSPEIADQFNVKRALIQNAFLPPFDYDEPLPGNVLEWLKHHKVEGFVICSANASKFITYNSEDLYGLDLCVAAALYFKKHKIKICIVYVISDFENSENPEQFKQRIIDEALEQYIFLHFSSLNFVALIKESDIVLRPTNTDGDALTVREGLYLGKFVIASDIVKRPEGTFCFNNRDIDSFITTILDTAEKKTKPHYSRSCKADYYISYYSKIYLQ